MRLTSEPCILQYGLLQCQLGFSKSQKYYFTFTFIVVGAYLLSGNGVIKILLLSSTWIVGFVAALGKRRPYFYFSLLRSGSNKENEVAYGEKLKKK